ncbi:MAG: hypothetical protein APR54_12560 [Candidatus Cloacimonas sp. SDB]|nr:MAG: hypothetical protein APR54_12560 [Candidatus Cloacimonas sp. SDB]
MKNRKYSFSQRMGYKPLHKEIQFESIDRDLKNKLWSLIYEEFLIKEQLKLTNFHGKYRQSYPKKSEKFKKIWLNFLKLKINEIPIDFSTYNKTIEEFFYKLAKWNEIYDLVEFIADQLTSNNFNDKKEFIEEINKIFEQEFSAYRFVEEQIVPITNEIELKSIKTVLKSIDKYYPVKEHIKDALSKLSDREKPDYRNSIKESISAVESLCKIITNDNKATLGKVLKKLKENDINLHNAQEKAWQELYGFTSDKSGIRHSLLEKSDITFADAKYMLVICCAFINYLVEQSN